MRKLLKTSVLLTIIGAIWACNNSREQSRIALDGQTDTKIQVKIERLDSLLFSCTNSEQIKVFIAQNQAFINTYFPQNRFGTSKDLEKMLLGLTQSQDLRKFHQNTLKLYNFQALTNQLSEVFTNLKKAYPQSKTPRIVTTFTGFTGTDLAVSDSLVIIGLDYFGGKKAPFRPNLFTYQLRRYEPVNIAPQIALLLSKRYNETNLADESLLAEMVYYGKSYVFAQSVLAQTPDSTLLGYSTEQIAETEAAQDLLWGHFVEEQLLYKTDGYTKNKYVGENPSTPTVGPRCPGSIGRWLGLKIVQKYMAENPKLSLQNLMQTANAQKILEGSKYRGEVIQQ